MTCADCKAAAERPWHGFTKGCAGCHARAVSRGPNFHASRQQGSLTREYIDELLRFGLDHAQVRQAVDSDAASKAAARSAWMDPA